MGLVMAGHRIIGGGEKEIRGSFQFLAIRIRIDSLAVQNGNYYYYFF